MNQPDGPCPARQAPLDALLQGAQPADFWGSARAPGALQAHCRAAALCWIAACACACRHRRRRRRYRRLPAGVEEAVSEARRQAAAAQAQAGYYQTQCVGANALAGHAVASGKPCLALP